MKYDFFQDGTGHYSMTRLLSFWAFILAGALSWYCAITHYDGSNYVYALLSFSAGIKIGNKFPEVKTEVNNATDK